MAVVIARTFIIYFSILITMRLLGKRQMGELELSEFVLAALVADLAAIPLQDTGIPLTNALVPILILFSFELVISGLSLRHIRLRTVLFGKPSILISHGKIDQGEMRKNRFTVDELMQELRNQGCLDISLVEYAVLETSGQLNVLLFPAEQPVTAAQLGLDAGPGGYPTIIVSDGRILEDNLRMTGRDLNWLNKQLKDRGHKNAEQVFLMTVNKSGQIYFSPKEYNP